MYTYYIKLQFLLINLSFGALPVVFKQKYPPSATTLHFEFYAEPGPEVKVERKVKSTIFLQNKNVIFLNLKWLF